MLPAHMPVAPSARSRGALLLFACAVALAVAALAGADGSFAAPATKPGAKPIARHATPAAKKGPADSTKVGATRALPDSLPRLEAAVRKDSTNVKALYKLGIAYLDRDRPIDAAVMFQKAVAIKKDYVEAWVNLGAAEDANGHGAYARQYYRTALGLRADDQIALCRMASSYYAAGIKDSAMDVIRNILKKDPNSSCAYFTLGVSFADANMFREAIRVWQKVVDLAPKSPEAESATESIKLLKDYLGPAEALAPAPVNVPGVAMGSGGPDNVIPGGEMGGAKFLGTGAAAGTAPAGGSAPSTGSAPATGSAPEKKPQPKQSKMPGT